MWHIRFSVLVATFCAFASGSDALGAAPEWMHDTVKAPLPEHDAKAEAVLLYSETIVTVQGRGKIRELERKAYRILRKAGEGYGVVTQYFTPQNRVTSLRGWSIPESGKDYEAKAKDFAERALDDVSGGELVTDVRKKIMWIPGAFTGAVVGYEVERELQSPWDATLEWTFQEIVPVGEARYTLNLPPGWTFRTFWLNHPETAPMPASPAGQTRWSMSHVRAIEPEPAMPPWRGVAGRMVLTLQPPDSKPMGFQSWQQLGTWYLALTEGRTEPSPEIRQKAQELAAASPDVLGKIRALASFAQKDIRYVAIELGIGGLQPHFAADVFRNRYGDCKDKVTLLTSMLNAIGVRSHYLIVNTRRGAVTEDTPPNLGFNHVIIGIELPDGTDAEKMPAFLMHKKLGRVLLFDPTHEFVPLGSLPGGLQASYGVLVSPEGGELLRLPETRASGNGLRRTGTFQLNTDGTLHGSVREVWLGDLAADYRNTLRAARNDVDVIKPIESRLAGSLANFEITKASVGNRSLMDRPLEWHYTLDARGYTKTAGDLLLVRPRVLGIQANRFLEESDHPRRFPIEFEVPGSYTDVFEIAVPDGYTVQEVPARMEQDLGSISYRSSTDVTGRTLRYTRTLEIKELSVQPAQAESLKQLYREIETDERNLAVLVRGANR